MTPGASGGAGAPGTGSSGPDPGRPPRVRPGEPGWPTSTDWDRLSARVGSRLVKVESPLRRCGEAASGPACAEVLRELRNPYYIGDQVGLTQSSGWADAWTSLPGAYAVAARSTQDVVAAVDFAREHNLRLVVKGGGHSYQGTSCAPDSLLICTRAIDGLELHDGFVGHGCEGQAEPQPAVTVGAGALWLAAYEAVTTRGSRYVQGVAAPRWAWPALSKAAASAASPNITGWPPPGSSRLRWSLPPAPCGSPMRARIPSSSGASKAEAGEAWGSSPDSRCARGNYRRNSVRSSESSPQRTTTRFAT